MKPFDKFIGMLSDVEPRDDGSFEVTCPLHEEDERSLRFRSRDDGAKVAASCAAGCELKRLAQWADLAPACLVPLDDSGGDADTLGPDAPKDRQSVGVNALIRGVPFPVEALPLGVREMAVEVSASVVVPPETTGPFALSSLSAAVGRRASVKAKNGYVKYPILWIAVVDDSGGGKSPAMEALASPLHALDDEAYQDYEKRREDYESELRVWESKKKSDPSSPRPQEPVCEQIVINDCTAEALMRTLKENPLGTSFLNDELSQLFGSFGAYKGGRGADETVWIKAHDAALPAKSNRVSKVTRVSRPACPIGGGIQPGIVAGTVAGRHRQNGIVQRFLWSLPPEWQRAWSEREVPDRVSRTWNELIRKLHHMAQRDEPLPLSPEAKRLFVEYANRLGVEQLQLKGALRGAVVKLEPAALKISLLFELVEWAFGRSTGKEISASSMAGALAIVEYFKVEAHRFHAFLDGAQLDRTPNALAAREQRIQSKGGTVSIRDWHRSRNRIDSATAERELGELVEAGRAEWFYPPGGRSKSVRLVGFAEEDTTDTDTSPLDEAAEGGSVRAPHTSSASEPPWPGAVRVGNGRWTAPPDDDVPF